MHLPPLHRLAVTSGADVGAPDGVPGDGSAKFRRVERQSTELASLVARIKGAATGVGRVVLLREAKQLYRAMVKLSAVVVLDDDVQEFVDYINAEWARSIEFALEGVADMSEATLPQAGELMTLIDALLEDTSVLSQEELESLARARADLEATRLRIVLEMDTQPEQANEQPSDASSATETPSSATEAPSSATETPASEAPSSATETPSEADEEDASTPMDDDDLNEGISPSQLADELANEAVVAPGEATQLEEGEVDVERGRQVLQQAKDEVVSLLRAVGDEEDALLPSGTIARIRGLLRRIAPFESASELARRMRLILESLSEREELDAPASGPGQQQQPSPADRPASPAFVGRASDVVRGRERQSFLLFEPPRAFTWVTLAGIRADPALSRLLDAYDGPKGADPTGRGFVVEILEATGPPQSRRYKPRWQTEPWVPLSAAQDGFYTAQQLVGAARELAAAFDRGLNELNGDEDGEDGEGDGPSDGDDDAEPGGATGGGPAARGDGQSQLEDPDGASSRPKRSALVFDASSGRPKISLRQAFNTLEGPVERWMVDAVFEYTVNRIHALDSRVPPADGEPGAPTAAEIQQLGKDLFSIDRTALIGAFRRERVQLERDRALAGDDVEDDDADEALELDEDRALEVWTEQREREFREAAVESWAAARREQAADRAELQAQLAAIKLIETAVDAGEEPGAALARAVADGVAAEVEAYLRPWALSPASPEWVRAFRRPSLKLPKIRDFLSPARSALAKGYLRLLRELHSAAPKRERQSGIYGSIYGPRWPQNPTATLCPPDHVLPQSWYKKGTATLLECADPGQVPAFVAIALLAENSAKSDAPLGHLQSEAEARAQGLYYSKTSLAKRARMAKLTAFSFSLYPLITDRKSAAGIGGFASGGSGVSWYARAWRYGTMQELVQLPATPFERRISLITASVPQWRVCDPITFSVDKLDADLRRVLERRMRGSDGVSRLVDGALGASVLSPPV